MYIITNGRTFLGLNQKNQPETVKTISSALTFFSRAKAENFMENIPKSLKNIGYEINELEEKRKIPGADAEVTKKMLSGNYMKEKAQDVESFILEIVSQKTQIEHEQIVTEREICDIVHAAEFYELNASKGYKLYSMLRDARLRRRKCKDAIRIIDVILKSSCYEIATGSVSDEVERMNERTYKPRVLEDLFSK